MENADVLGPSTAPLTWHDFLERMRQPSASDFVKAIKSFIVSFSNNAPDPEKDSAAVQQFLANMEAAFRAHSLWAGCSEEELESAGEGLEKYVMTKLFPRVFASIPDDVKLDEQLFEKMALIQQFIHPENLDIKPLFQNETSWLLAQKELQKINMHKAPRDKLACILNCCKVINNILLKASIASNENPPGADEFLPVLIYVTIKANPPQLHSNLLYIQRYRCQSRLVAETAYFFTNMLSAESFISNIDANSLSMDEAEFEKNMESARALLSGLSGDLDALSHPSNQSGGHVPKAEPMEPKRHALNSMKNPSMEDLLLQSSEQKSRNEELYAKDQLPITKAPSVSDLENQGATMLLKEDQVSQVFRDFPYLYAHVGDLTINDVEDLLNNYKQLVFKYVCLSKGLGVTTPPQIQNTSETMKKSEGTIEVDMNNDSHEDAGPTDDGLAGASLFEAENSQSKLPEDDGVAQSAGHEISQ
ncbi:vacuolar protein sorting-associated protein 9A-like [Malania oleifera]|uniref:vacuolar protein sorting-associated protein 9A-like n=1 Tax=Malania oleifera TaxID=397392 RepID=UPI0025ADCD7C|nr:vacuolar protein sorting-associated protein 9A-like [Malania oleifera]